MISLKTFRINDISFNTTQQVKKYDKTKKGTKIVKRSKLQLTFLI